VKFEQAVEKLKAGGVITYGKGKAWVAFNQRKGGFVTIYGDRGAEKHSAMIIIDADALFSEEWDVNDSFVVREGERLDSFIGRLRRDCCQKDGEEFYLRIPGHNMRYWWSPWDDDDYLPREEYEEMQGDWASNCSCGYMAYQDPLNGIEEHFAAEAKTLFEEGIW
jgi:hypothetical protein